VTIGGDAPRLYVRASCKGNPGTGGWGAVLEQAGETTQVSGSEPETTNNRMELRAVLEGLRLLPAGQPVHLFTTSDYVFQGATSWIGGWRRRNWEKQDGKPIANADLWRELEQLLKAHTINWVNAKGMGEEMPQGLREAARLAVEAREIA
jgi:ribonuclease HI